MAFIQLRSDTAAAWTSLNPILLEGEPGRDETNSNIKIGNGITPWNELPYEYISASKLNVANGIATLDASSKLKSGQLPSHSHPISLSGIPNDLSIIIDKSTAGGTVVYSKTFLRNTTFDTSKSKVRFINGNTINLTGPTIIFRFNKIDLEGSLINAGINIVKEATDTFSFSGSLPPSFLAGETFVITAYGAVGNVVDYGAAPIEISIFSTLN